MGISLLTINNLSLSATPQSFYSAPNFMNNNSASEANHQTVFGVAGTLGGPSCPATIKVDAVGALRTWISRKNTANGNISIAMTDTTAGVYSDAVHSDSIAAGDLVAWKNLVTGSSPTANWFSVGFVATANHAAIYAVVAATNIGFGTTRSIPLAGNTSNSLTESNAHVIRQAATAQYLSVHLTANTYGSGLASFRTRKNGSNGNALVNFAAGVTGVVSDTVNTDSLASGDLFNYQETNNAAAGSITFDYVGCTMVNSAGNSTNDIFFANSNTTGLTSTTQTFANLGSVCGGTNFTTTEANAKMQHGFAVTVSKLRLYVAGNATGATSTIVSRKNGANGNMSISVGSGVTGLVEDTTNSDSLTSTDDWCWAVTPGGVGAFAIQTGAVTEQDATVAAAQPYTPWPLLAPMLAQ